MAANEAACVMEKVGSLIRTVGPVNLLPKVISMTMLPVGHSSDTSQRLLSVPLAALCASTQTPLRDSCGLPEGAIDIAPAGLILAATPCSAPMFAEAVAEAAERLDRDVLLIRSGFLPEILDLVTVDVALITLTGPILLRGLIFYRHANGGLWLVPEQGGPAIGLDERGLRRAPVLPFSTYEERSAGLCRAAAEIVRLTRQVRGR